jgi:hypothetical protein
MAAIIKDSKEFLSIYYRMCFSNNFNYSINKVRNYHQITIRGGNIESKFNFWDDVYLNLSEQNISFDKFYFLQIIDVFSIGEDILPNSHRCIRFINRQLTIDDVVHIADKFEFNEHTLLNLLYSTQDEILIGFNYENGGNCLECGHKKVDIYLPMECLERMHPGNQRNFFTDDLKIEFKEYVKNRDKYLDLVHRYGEVIENIVDVCNRRENMSQDTFMRTVSKYLSKDRSIKRVDTTKQKTYIMVDKTTNLYKIGKALDPKYREKTLQSQKPSIELLHVMHKNVESELHKMYKDLRVRGEWFNLSDAHINNIIYNFN